MKYQLVAHIIGILWVLLIAYWIVSAFGNKKAKARQSRLSRLAYVAVLVGTWYALRSQQGLRVRLLPINAATQSMGLLLCAGGIALAIWARRILGRNWSGLVTIKEDHELIQCGPYQSVRHPIYTGLILALTGTVLALNPTARGFLLDLVWVAAFYVKARHEEYLLTREFGERYGAYKRRVKSAIIPFVL